MARFHGNVGFIHTEETSLGVWTEVEEVHECVGDVVQDYSKWSTTSEANDTLSMSNRVSILLDGFVSSNLGHIRWVELYSTKWKVTGIELKRPRVILTLGGAYHGDN